MDDIVAEAHEDEGWVSDPQSVCAGCANASDGR